MARTPTSTCPGSRGGRVAAVQERAGTSASEREELAGQVIERSRPVTSACTTVLTRRRSAHVSSRAFSASSKMTPRLPNRAGKVYLSFSSAADPCAIAIASSCLYEGCHGSISLAYDQLLLLSPAGISSATRDSLVSLLQLLGELPGARPSFVRHEPRATQYRHAGSGVCPECRMK